VRRRTLLASSFASLLVLAAGSARAQVPRDEYAQRRAAFAARMSDGVLLVVGAHEPSHDYLSFYQSEPFAYLTGLDEPGAALVVAKQDGRVDATLFVESRDPAREVWSGHRLGAEGATAATGIAARPVGELARTLDSLAATAKRLYVVGDGEGDEEGGEAHQPKLVRQLREKHAGLEVVNAAPLAMMLRGKKSAAELDLVRKAAEITADAHREVGKLIEPGTNEFEAQALIEYTFRRDGADRPSFATIVGSGPNSTTLHYNRNDRFMDARDVVVIDIGASYRGYAADVTRTFPVSGSFTPDQRAIYQLVRDAQAAAERQATLGAPARLMEDSAQATLAAGLAKLGLIESPTATYECAPGRQCSQLGLYYMHAIGHGIGLEVHDPDQYYFTGVIAPGSAFTIEPGVYVRANVLETLPATPRNARVADAIRKAVERYAGIGVRIEDDYVATERGVEWISRAPREADEIEALMRQPYAGPAPRDAKKVEWYRTTEPRK
jgi:Xaa-Pro aminopeptidase